MCQKSAGRAPNSSRKAHQTKPQRAYIPPTHILSTPRLTPRRWLEGVRRKGRNDDEALAACSLSHGRNVQSNQTRNTLISPRKSQAIIIKNLDQLARHISTQWSIQRFEELRRRIECVKYRCRRRRLHFDWRQRGYTIVYNIA